MNLRQIFQELLPIQGMERLQALPGSIFVCNELDILEHEGVKHHAATNREINQI